MAACVSSRVPDWITPMPTKADGGWLRTGPEWAYEYKLDGYRTCMQIPHRVEYRLTPADERLQVALDAMTAWAEQDLPRQVILSP
jgi:hypothetical protein